MEIQETLNSYRKYAAEWHSAAQAAQGRLDKEIGIIRKKIKMLEVSTKDIERRWLERLLTGESTVRRPPRHMEKLARWHGVLEALKPMQKISLALSQDRHEFAALINTCEKHIEYTRESQERLSKFQALVAAFPGDKGLSAQAEQEASTVKKRLDDVDGALTRMASLLADAKKRGFVTPKGA
jgi:hypothetical protein